METTNSLFRNGDYDNRSGDVTLSDMGIELVGDDTPNDSDSCYAIELMSSDEDIPVRHFDDSAQVFIDSSYLPITFQDQKSAENIAAYLRSYRNQLLEGVLIGIRKAMRKSYE